MAKWADFVIKAVKYDSTHSHIIEVKRSQHDDNKNKLYDEQIRSRNAVVKAIENKGYTYVTAYKDKDGMWEKGEDVHIVKIDGKKYLRTDSNKTTKDNLGKLLEF